MIEKRDECILTYIYSHRVAVYVNVISVMLQLVEAPTTVLVTLLRNLCEVSPVPAAIGSEPLNAHEPLKALTAPTIAANSIHASVTGAFASPTAATAALPLLKSSKIVSFVEEVPREFNVWAWRQIRMPADDFLTTANLQRDSLKLLFETVRQLLDLARELSSLPEEKAIEFLQTSMTRQLISKLPSSERLQAYITHIDDLCTMQEWLDIFDTPTDMVLESEKVWPVEPFLKVSDETVGVQAHM